MFFVFFLRFYAFFHFCHKFESIEIDQLQILGNTLYFLDVMHYNVSFSGSLVNDKMQYKLKYKVCTYWQETKNTFGENDEISSEILPSFRTEAVGDRDVTFNQIKGS